MEIVLDSGVVSLGFKELTESDWIRVALEQSCQEIRAEALEKHDYADRTGNLSRAIHYEIDKQNLVGDVSIDSIVAPYGAFVHEPTGTHAPAEKRMKSKYHRYPDGSYAIRSTKYKALHLINKGGKDIFRRLVKHPGTPADPFIYYALENKEDDAVNIFRMQVKRAIEGAKL